MKFNYDCIRHNLASYEEAKSKFPSISQYERGEISSSAMRSINLGRFAQFYDFLKMQETKGFNPIIENMTWRKLKPLLIEKTKNPRFKKYLSNRTQNQFIELLGDLETYDRLLNGRWLRKPRLTKRGRTSSGLRGKELMEGLDICIIPILNFIIQNDIEVFDTNNQKNNIDSLSFKSFRYQDRYQDNVTWFCEKINFDDVPYREIEVTGKLIDSFVNILEESKIDPRKLNLEYVINVMTERLKKGMTIPQGTNLKCLQDILDGSNGVVFTKDKAYKLHGSYVNGGSLNVYLTNDLGRNQYVKYLHFEDMSLHRDNLLGSLFGE